MKTIQVLYGKTTSKFFGAFGLIVHSAICGASQKTMPYKGAVCSKLSMVNRFVNVQSEGKSISLVARLNDARLPKFLSHSRNVKIKQSNLTGFFTLNPTHAQSVIGLTGLLKGRLAYFGISVSKNNVLSPNFHFSLSMKKDRICPSAMLKRMAAQEQESSIAVQEQESSEKGLAVSSTKAIALDLGTTADTDQNRLESTTACPKKGSEDVVTTTGQIKKPDTVLTIITEAWSQTKQDIVSVDKLKDEYMTSQKALHRERSKTLANLFAEDNERLMLKQVKKELDNSQKNRRKSEEDNALQDNLSTSLLDEIENYNEIDIHIQQIQPKYWEQINETELIIHLQMIPFFQNLREDFIELKNFIENVLIAGYQKDYDDCSLNKVSYISSYAQRLQKFFIHTSFSIDSKKRLKPFFQQKQEEMKKLENPSQFPEEMDVISSKLSKLEDLENKVDLECQFLEYREIIENILKIYLYERHLENDKKCFFIDYSADLLLLNNFRARINAFCQVASKCIFIGHLNVLGEIGEIAQKNQNGALERDRRILAQLLERQQRISRWNDRAMKFCEIETEVELAPSAWE